MTKEDDMFPGMKKRILSVQLALICIFTAALALPVCAGSTIHVPEYPEYVRTEAIPAEQTDPQEEEPETAAENDAPSAPEGCSLDGRDCLFANGTSITLLPPESSAGGYEHDTELQSALGNGLSPENHGNGAMIIWSEGANTRYVYVSGQAAIFGGAKERPLVSDTKIILRGEDAVNACPKVAYLFGGSLHAALTGNVRISLTESQVTCITGGGYNGNVIGNVEIKGEGRNWAMDIVGGGAALSGTQDAQAGVDGNIIMKLQGETYAYTDCIAGGGCAITSGSCTATADVTGSIVMELAGQDVYQVCAGGLAYAPDENGSARANVMGNTSLKIDGVLRSDLQGDDPGDDWPGMITGYGMAHFGEAKVSGAVNVEAEAVAAEGSVKGVLAEPVVENGKEAETVYNSDADLIYSMQNALNDAGYDCGEPDGSLGPATIEAMQAYQADHGQEVTADVKESLLISLNVLP